MGEGGRAAVHQVSCKVDLLLIDNDREEKKGAKNVNHIKFLENYW